MDSNAKLFIFSIQCIMKSSCKDTKMAALNVDFGSSFNVLSISEVALDSFAVEFWGWVVLYSIVLSSMMLLTLVRAHDELVYFMFTNTIA